LTAAFRRPPPVVRRRDRPRADGDARSAEGRRIQDVRGARPEDGAPSCQPVIIQEPRRAAPSPGCHQSTVIRGRRRAPTSPGCRRAACTPVPRSCRRGSLPDAGSLDGCSTREPRKILSPRTGAGVGPLYRSPRHSCLTHQLVAVSRNCVQSLTRFSHPDAAARSIARGPLPRPPAGG